MSTIAAHLDSLAMDKFGRAQDCSAVNLVVRTHVEAIDRGVS